MKIKTEFILNIIYFFIIFLLALAIATMALTKKVNDYNNQLSADVRGTVIKRTIPVDTPIRGIVKVLNVQIGQEVKKGDLLAELDNKELESKVKILDPYKNDPSAQTEAKIAQEELKSLEIYAPIDGIVGELYVTEGSPVDDLGKILTIYSNEDIKLLAYLRVRDYQIVSQLHEIRAYSERLNQNFYIVPDILSPELFTSQTTGDKRIGMYFTFKDKADATYLLNKEDLILRLDALEQEVLKPIDIFIKFWNSVFSG